MLWGIFPEGTRSKRTEAPFLLPGKTGFARLAASYPDVPVVPIGLTGTKRIHDTKQAQTPTPMEESRNLLWQTRHLVGMAREK